MDSEFDKYFQSENRTRRMNSGSQKAGVRKEAPAQNKRKPQPKKEKKAKKWYDGLLSNRPVDGIFLMLVFILVIMGLIMCYSASYPIAQSNLVKPSYYITRQAVFTALGIVGMFVVSFVNYRKFLFNKFIPVLGYIGVFGLLALAIVTSKMFGASNDRFIMIGKRALLEPSEFAKFTLILMMAYIIGRTYGKIKTNNFGDSSFWAGIDGSVMKRIRKFLPNASTESFKITCIMILPIALYLMLIVVQGHLSCLILMYFLGLFMLWVGGVKKGYLVIGLLAFLLLAFVVVKKPDMLHLKDYQYERITAWIDKNYSPLDKRLQTNNSLKAIASGGLLGKGLGKSIYKHSHLPAAHTDFIFAVICEEFGLVGVIVFLAFYLALIIRILMISAKCKDIFGAALGAGIGIQLALQLVIHIGVDTDMLPNTGMVLPFFSYGGTGVLVTLVEMGVILSISRRSAVNKVHGVK